MEIILIVVVVVFIAAIAALLIIKKRQASLDETPVIPPANRQRLNEGSSGTLENLESAAQPATQPTPQATQVADPLATVDLLVNDQRYDDAIAQLKRHLMANPKNTQAMLKLLQIYGITNNQNAFNQLHQKIHEIGDDETIQQADFCRSLLEDDFTPVASSTPQVANKAIDIDTLDFDVGNSEATHHNLANQDVDTQADTLMLTPIDDSDAVNDFEDAFDLSFDESSAQTTTASSHSDASDDIQDEAFDLDFDLSATPTNNSTSTGIHTAVDSESLDSSLDDDLFDLSFDEPIQDLTSPSTPQSTPTLAEEFNLDSDLSLDNTLNDALSLDDSSHQTTPNTTNDSLDLDGFDLDTYSDNLNTSTTSQDDALDLSSDLDLGDDFNFDTILSESKPVDIAPSFDATDSNLNLDDSLSLTDENLDDGFNFEAISAPKPNTQESTKTLTDNDLDLSFDDSVFDKPNDSNKTTTNLDGDTLSFELPISDTHAAPTNTESFDDNLSFSLDNNKADDALQADDLDLSFDLNDDLSLDGLSTDTQAFSSNSIGSDNLQTGSGLDENKATIAPAVLSPAPKVNDLSNDLSFTQDLSSTQITLTLAEQYLNLGEHDSARRLLEEVVAHGQGSEQQKAQNLLNHLG